MNFLKNFTLKHRHLLTSAGNIRVRYVVAALAVMAVCVWGLVSGFDDNDPVIIVETVDLVEKMRAPETRIYSDDPEEAGRGLGPYYANLGKKPEYTLPPKWTKTITVKSGDTLGALMEKTTLSGDDYRGAMKAIRKHFDPRDILPGQTIDVHFRNVDNEGVWQAVDYRIDGLKSITIRRDAHGAIIADKTEKKVDVFTHAAKTVVENSLYADLSKAGVPDGIINKLIQAYSWSVDFQRDIWGGEKVELFYETKETKDGEYMRSGRLLYAKLGMRNNKELPMYLFEKEPKYFAFFEPNGQSVKKALLKTPVDGARLSSGFGRRKHPVLGYTKMHKGLDFAAPTGTPIYAAGDGVVERANRFSSFGNYVKIRHNEKYKTAYAHLHKFARGIRKGSRVKQGQVIGYVGTTGRSTGPHLHYEVHVNGRAVNPQSMKLPIGEKLKGKKLSRFKRELETIKANFERAISDRE